MQMPPKTAVASAANAALDALYTKSFGATLKRIESLSKSRGSKMQASLKKLDDEAKRLKSEKKRMTVDNAQLRETISDYQDLLNEAAVLIDQHGNALQESAVELAVVAVAAKVFIKLSDQMIAAGISPVSAKALAFYESQIERLGAGFVVPSSLDFARNYVDSAAWVARLDKWGAGYANLSRDAVLKAIQQGAGPRAVASQMRQYAEGIPASAAESLTRTLQLTSYREASLAMEKLNGDFIEYKIRIAELDGDTCLSCIALHGTRLEVGERVDDHMRGRCELPDNLISGPSISALVSRNYNGDIVVIHTASGKFLPVTPNHPILTDRGWLPAHLLCKGGNVVGSVNGEGASFGTDPNKNHVPTRAEDISNSLGMYRFGTMPITAQDFHGDGIKGDVGIVYANRFLRNGRNTNVAQKFSEIDFVSGASRISFSALCDLLGVFKRKRFSPERILSGLDIFLSNFGRSLFFLEPIGVGHASSFDPGFSQPYLDNLSRNFQGLSDLIFRFSSDVPRSNIGNRHGVISKSGLGYFDRLNISAFGFVPEQPLSLEIIKESLVRSFSDSSGDADVFSREISLDPILDVGIRSFSGHVYSLQSNNGWYISNGIISHNCTEFYVVPGGGLPEFMQADSNPGNRNFVPFQTGPEWFASLSPERQAAQASFKNSPAKLAAFRSGVELQEFVGEHVDDVFGNQIIENSLAQAIGQAAAEEFYT